MKLVIAQDFRVRRAYDRLSSLPRMWIQGHRDIVLWEVTYSEFPMPSPIMRSRQENVLKREQELKVHRMAAR